MGKLSREKGKRGEREVVKLFEAKGIPARRGQQFCGANGDADVITALGDLIHVEVKRQEVVKIHEWLKQAEADSPFGSYPMVFHRRSKEGWKVTLRAEDLIDIIADLYETTKEIDNE
jgi:Holliday junction resolvase